MPVPITAEDVAELEKDVSFNRCRLRRLEPDGDDVRMVEKLAAAAILSGGEEAAARLENSAGISARGAVAIRIEDSADPPAIWQLEEIPGLDLSVSVYDPDDEGAQLRVDPFTLAGWEALRRVGLSGAPSADLAAEWVRSVNRLFDEIDEWLVRGDDALPPYLASLALSARIADGFGELDMPAGLDYDMLCRYAARQDLERDLRGVLADGGPPVSPPPLPEIEGLQELPGGIVRRGALEAAAGDDRDMRRLARANDALVRHVFRPLTRTPAEMIYAARCPADSLRPYLDGRQAGITGLGPAADGETEGWAAAAEAAVRGQLRTVFGDSYQPTLRLAPAERRGGWDVLAVIDHGAGYLYRWPARERQAALQHEGQPGIPMVDPADCPTPGQLVEQAHRDELEAGPDESAPAEAEAPGTAAAAETPENAAEARTQVDQVIERAARRDDSGPSP